MFRSGGVWQAIICVVCSVEACKSCLRVAGQLVDDAQIEQSRAREAGIGCDVFSEAGGVE